MRSTVAGCGVNGSGRRGRRTALIAARSFWKNDQRVMKLNWRFATVEDAGLLGRWNWQLIRDEGHRNPLTVDDLAFRMRGWFAEGYRAVIFQLENAPVGYALYRFEDDGLYLRQFFICGPRRRRGLGRAAFRILREEIWPKDLRISVAALCGNAPGLAFWRAAGFTDYCLTLEMMPEQNRT